MRQRWWRRPTRLALLALAALPAAWYLVPLVRHIPAAEPMVVIAHRGSPSSSGAPENTLAAFRAAIDAGADWLEFDVRATRDGRLLVLHDATVDRTTDGRGAIAGLTLEQARALDAGNGERIPTADEVVELAKAAGVPILPEVKDGRGQPAIAPALVDLLRATGYADRTVVQAFEAETLLALRDLAPDLRTCWLTGPWQLDLSSPPADARYLCPMAEMVLLNPDVVRAGHASGRTVFAWWNTAETTVTSALLAGYGVDGIMVDDLRTMPAPP